MTRIAVIGTGISGSLAARLLSTKYDVTVFEQNDYPGGHANTVDISLSGKQFSVDTGFMVFNRRTYPNFCRLLQLLKIRSRASDMSFSVRCGATGLEYQGSSLNGLFAQRRNCLRPPFLRMLWDIVRFNRHGMRAAQGGILRDGQTVGEFLASLGLGQPFVDRYLAPMAAAIWSAKPEAILEFPAEFMIGFFANHGLMQLRDRPQWRTILEGSRTYVGALLEPIKNRLRLKTPVVSVMRKPQAVFVQTSSGPPLRFDHVVLASHADQSLKMLADPTDFEQQILGSFPYQRNEAVLHTDSDLLPKRQRAWASWNYHIPDSANRAASVTYDLSRLQGLASESPILLTLNASSDIDPAKVVRTFTYFHPAYTEASIDAQSRFHEVSGRQRTHFCGAYWGYGFHEDGVNSALAVAKQFGLGLEACTVASMKEQSLTVATSQ